MKTIFQNRWLIFTLRLVLGAIFIIAGIAKLHGYYWIYQYRRRLWHFAR